MATPLHGGTAPEGPSQVGPVSLVEFRAGRMQFTSGRVLPDTRKGSIRVTRTDDGLLHFQWLDRATGVIEEDQIVFPEEAVFEKVTQSGGRVYLLRFNHDDRKFFFWMQEPKSADDASLCQAVNRELNNTAWFEGQPNPDDAEFDEEMVQSLLRDGGAMSEQQATAILPSATLAPHDSVTPIEGLQPVQQPLVQLSDLQSILSGLGQLAVPPGSGSGSGSVVGEGFVPVGPSLTEVLKPELVLPLLQNGGVQERLGPYLPEGLRTLEAMRDLIQSPQFHQQLEVFSHLLQCGQVDWSQFGIDPSKYGYGVTAFLSAIEDQFQSESTADSVEIPAEGQRNSGKEEEKEEEISESDKEKGNFEGFQEKVLEDGNSNSNCDHSGPQHNNTADVKMVDTEETQNVKELDSDKSIDDTNMKKSMEENNDKDGRRHLE